MLFEEFQDCHHGCHLGYWNWTIQQFWISMSLSCLPSNFSSTWRTVWEEMWYEEFQDGDHLGHWNRRTLAILNFHNIPMDSIKFKLNQTYRSVAVVISMAPTMFGLNLTGFGSRCGFKNFQDGVAILDSQTERFKQFWISTLLRCFPSSFGSIQLTRWEEMSFEEFQNGRHGGHHAHIW